MNLPFGMVSQSPTCGWVAGAPPHGPPSCWRRCHERSTDSDLSWSSDESTSCIWCKLINIWSYMILLVVWCYICYILLYYMILLCYLIAMHQVARQNCGKITHQSCANFPFKLCVRVSVIANCVPCLGVNEERMPWSSLPSCWKALTILAQPGNCNPAAQYLRVPGWTATQKGMIWRLRIVFHGHGGVITAIQIWVPPNNRMHSKIDPRHNPMRSHLGEEEPKIFHPPSAFHSTNDGYMIFIMF